MPGTPVPKKKSIVYIDGFNLYYGLMRGGPYKWLNLQKYFERLRPDDDIQAIRYFTAMIAGARRSNRRTYLRALETLPLVETILGRFKDKQVNCTVLDWRLPAIMITSHMIVFRS